MTDGPVRVMPRKALNAVPSFNPGHSRFVLLPDTATAAEYTDAEFAAHFVPADAYERLLAAVELHVDEMEHMAETITGVYPTENYIHGERCGVCAAYRVFVGTDD